MTSNAAHTLKAKRAAQKRNASPYVIARAAVRSKQLSKQFARNVAQVQAASAAYKAKHYTVRMR
jgi:hypothetical protein